MALGTWYVSQAAEEVKQVATGRYVLNTLYVINVAAAKRYIWVFDNTASSGTVLAGPLPVNSGDFVCLGADHGIGASTGIRVASSTTGDVFTASAGSDLRMMVGYSPTTNRRDQNN